MFCKTCFFLLLKPSSLFEIKDSLQNGILHYYYHLKTLYEILENSHKIFQLKSHYINRYRK
jgi:hypothetical protein